MCSSCLSCGDAGVLRRHQFTSVDFHPSFDALVDQLRRNVDTLPYVRPRSLLCPKLELFSILATDGIQLAIKDEADTQPSRLPLVHGDVSEGGEVDDGDMVDIRPAHRVSASGRRHELPNGKGEAVAFLLCQLL